MNCHLNSPVTPTTCEHHGVERSRAVLRITTKNPYLLKGMLMRARPPCTAAKALVFRCG